MFAVASPHAFVAGLIDRPLAMAPEAAATAYDVFSMLDLSALAPGALIGDSAAERPYEIDDGVATIPLHGQMASRATWFTDVLGLPAYDRVATALVAAAADRDVRGVLLDIDSPGGDLAGATELAAKVRAVAATKPVVAFVDSLAASAAYVIAAGAGKIVVAPSATVGSIGVVWLHLDRSQAMKQRGLKPTLLHAGAYKIDGHSMGPLPDEPRARIQNQINDAHDLIVQSVGRHRPALGATGARKTEAAIFMGAKAVAARLADAVGTRETALAYLFPAPASAPPSTAARAVVHALTIGAKAVSTSPIASPLAGAPPASPLARLSQVAVYQASRRAARVVAANAMMMRHLGDQSLDDHLRLTVARVTKSPPAAAPAKPAAGQSSDDMWREIAAKRTTISPLRSCFK